MLKYLHCGGWCSIIAGTNNINTYNMNTQETLTNKALYLLSIIEKAKKPVRIDSLQGTIWIDNNTFNFTFMGKWGNAVLMHMIKKDVLHNSKMAERLIILAAHMEEYSKKYGGITIS